MKNILPLLALFFFLFNNAYSQASYVEKGKASFYASKFDGRKTASGEKFSNKKLTAAHKTLPFGTMVRVTNLKNKKSVIVRVNDRGPYVKGRIIDLTKAAADSLDFIHSGWAEVLVEEIKEEPEVPVILVENKILDDSSVFKFPYDWIGKWKGDLKIYAAEGLKDVVPMELNIASTSDANRFEWQIIYKGEVRDYELLIRDSVKKIFSINEKNGIDIFSYLLGNQLISRFDVEGQLLESSYHMQLRNQLEFEIHSGNAEKAFTTGNVVSENDSVPAVGVYNMRILQVALLKRM